MKLSGNKILITGGATGIGFGLAERFVQEGNTVIICGRREQALQEAREKIPSLITTTCDLQSAPERENLLHWVKREHPDMNVLINNAGIQQWMNIDDKDFFERAQQEISINVETPVHMVKLFLQIDSLNTIMNVTSGLAFSPLAKTPVYGGTKAFMRSFTLSLRYLLQPKNIEVIELIPPALNTDLGGKGIHDSAPPVSDFINTVFEQLRDGKKEITFGFSEAMINAGPGDLRNAFARMNPAPTQ